MLTLLGLALFFGFRHSGALNASFFSDDFILFDKVRDAPIASAFGFDHLAYHWYRPWSRELHYRLLERLFGANPLPFHLALIALWLATMWAFYLVAGHLGGPRLATFAACGCAALAP